ncbi:hypothetical protein ES703_41653 [subsurface metagenome]
MQNFEGTNRQGAMTAKERIESIYSNDSPDTKKTIKEWIEGITVDDDEGGFLSCKINDEGKIVVEDEDDSKILPLSKLSSDELWGLWVDFKNLLEKLGEADG